MCKVSAKGVVPTGPACASCYEAFDKGGWAEDYEWSALCVAVAADDALRAEFEKTVSIVKGLTQREYNQSVELRKQTGSRVVSRYLLLKGTTLEQTLQGATAKDLGLQMSSIPGEDGSDAQRGVLVRHPAAEVPEVEVYAESYAITRE